MTHRRTNIALAALAALAVTIGILAFATAGESPRTDSRNPYVHRLTLYDEDGKAIDPKDSAAQPYSPRATCGKCHDYEKISAGYHFNAPDRSVDPGPRGEPWIFTDARTRTQLPLSARDWAGARSLNDLALTPWTFVQSFGRHMPGGGLGDKFADTPADPNARWNISGKLDIDCLICHSADNRHDPAERAAQLSSENYKWAPVAAAGLAIVQGQARNLAAVDPNAIPDPDPEKANAPAARPSLKIVYDKTRFDLNDRVTFNVTRRPAADRCYFCHSARQVGNNAPMRWQTDKDVHLAAGLTCTDCHRNGIDHNITRGRESAAQDSGAVVAPSATTQTPNDIAMSCRGCHLGTDQSQAGRLGAPRPRHAGLPAVHFDKLTCTACHSGPMPQDSAGTVQTSMAHGLGLSSQDRRDDATPYIAQPVMVKGPDGKIAPTRMMWPSFWAYRKKNMIPDNRITPLSPQAVAKLAAAALPEAKDSAPLSHEQIIKVLKALAVDKEAGDPLYVHGGNITTLNGYGYEENAPYNNPLALPYSWAIGHDVRPAQQALGANNNCRQCHNQTSPFMFGKVATELGRAPSLPMTYFEEQDPALAANFAMSFMFRPYLKITGFVSSAIVAAILALYGLGGLRVLLRRFAGRQGKVD